MGIVGVMHLCDAIYEKEIFYSATSFSPRLKSQLAADCHSPGNCYDATLWSRGFGLFVAFDL